MPEELRKEYENGQDPSSEWYEHGSVGLARIVKHYMGGRK
jgi:hypothetical protein